MRVNIRTSFFGKILYYLCIVAFMLSTGIAMAQGEHEIRTPYNHSFELEGNTIPLQNLWSGYPGGFDDFDDVYLDIVDDAPATPVPPGFAAGTPEAAEWWGGGVLYKEPTEGLTNAYIETFIWDDFRVFTDLDFDTSMTFGADPSTAGPGMKDQNDISLWTCVPSNNLGPKFDLRQAYLAFYREPHDPPENHLLMFGGGIRDSNNGSVAIGFWLFNSEVECDFDDTSPTYGKFIDPDGNVASHDEGDALLVSDFTAGGGVYNIHAWQWQCVDPNDPKTCGPEEMDLSILGPDYVYGDCKSSLTDPNDINGYEPGEMLMCGTVNDEDQSPIMLAWDPHSTLKNSIPYELQTGQFFEGGVDLTELTGFGEDKCVSSFVLETRSSHKIDAKLHDFIGGRLNTCGTIIVKKITDPTPDATLFDFNVNDGDGYSYDFSLADAGEEIIGSVLPGTYAVSELAEPASWTLYEAQCGRDTDEDGIADSGFFDPRDQDVEVGLSEVYVCTFWNVKDATLTLHKTVTNDNGGTLSQDDFPVFINTELKEWDITYTYHPDGSGITLTASETPQPGYTAGDWTGQCAANGLVTLLPGDNKDCYIINDDQQAYITVNKIVNNDHGGTAQPDDFKLTLEGSPVVSGIAVPVNPGTYTAAETLLPGYAFDGFSEDCDSNGDTTVALGESKSCTLTNHDLQAYITVIKEVINDNGGTAQPDDFNLTLAGNPVVSGVANPVDPGTYFSDETLLSGYTFEGYTSDCATDGNTTVALGESKTCTLTNNDEMTYETAYAMGPDNTCFDELGANNWGWVNGNGLTSVMPGTYYWPVWAGAAQCDTSNGTLVGEVIVDYDGEDVSITWNLDTGVVLDQEHVYAGYDLVPPGGFAPGQYEIYGPFNGEPIYIIVHAVVGVPQ